jgi:aryl-alcohol dehydrogenase-like predicted oxidoreductase
MKTRKLRNLEVSAIGFGCMGFSHGYGPVPDRSESVQLIRHAFELGCTHFDTAEGYGAGDNEMLVGEALHPMRNQVVIATKFRVVEGTAASPVGKQVRAHLDASLKRLGTDRVELYYQHRQNPAVPIEEIAESMGELISEGKILGWGLSQVAVELIRRAHAVTPLAAIQSEYSIMERMFEHNVIPACKELNIGFVAFSPLASGFLSGKARAETQYQGDDVRRVITRFAPENITANQPLVELLQKFADAKNATPAQISLAWMLAKEPFITPIPGSRKIERIEENLGAADVELTDTEMEALEKELAKIETHGNRTDEDIARLYRSS